MFLFTFTSFGVVLLLGGPQHSTLEVEIYRQTAQLLDLEVAAALALVQLVAVVAILDRHQPLASDGARSPAGCGTETRQASRPAPRASACCSAPTSP